MLRNSRSQTESLRLRILACGLVFVCSAYAEEGGVRIDEAARRVSISGRVAKQNVYEQLKGAIEYIACCPGGKEYESLFVCPVSPVELRAALIKIGAKAGKPAREEEGTPLPPAGDRLKIEIEWEEAAHKRRVPVETFVLDAVTGKPTSSCVWTFTGSRESKDPASGKAVLEATLTKNLVSLHQIDPSVLVQNAAKEAREDNRYKANLPALPKEGTPVTVFFEPVVPGPDQRRIHAFISGHVQGVGFRAFVQRNAKSLNLRGWVRNLPTGEVEVIAEGSQKEMQEFESQIRQGPRGATVDGVKIEEAKDGEALGEFEVRPTPESGNK